MERIVNGQSNEFDWKSLERYFSSELKSEDEVHSFFRASRRLIGKSVSPLLRKRNYQIPDKVIRLIEKKSIEHLHYVGEIYQLLEVIGAVNFRVEEPLPIFEEVRDNIIKEVEALKNKSSNIHHRNSLNKILLSFDRKVNIPPNEGILLEKISKAKEELERIIFSQKMKKQLGAQRSWNIVGEVLRPNLVNEEIINFVLYLLKSDIRDIPVDVGTKLFDLGIFNINSYSIHPNISAVDSRKALIALVKKSSSLDENSSLKELTHNIIDQIGISLKESDSMYDKASLLSLLSELSHYNEEARSLFNEELGKERDAKEVLHYSKTLRIGSRLPDSFVSQLIGEIEKVNPKRLIFLENVFDHVIRNWPTEDLLKQRLYKYFQQASESSYDHHYSLVFQIESSARSLKRSNINHYFLKDPYIIKLLAKDKERSCTEESRVF